SSPVYLPESLSQAIYVPTQKITTLHPGVGVVAVEVATALASGQATSGDGRRDAGGDEGGEDDIDLRLSSAALSATPALLQSVTGMHTNAVDARRAMALVEQADVDGAAGSSGRYDNSSSSYAPSATLASAAAAAVASSRQGRGGKPSAPAWEVSRVGGVGGRPDDAAALVRRAKALGVPPLPPDLGAVRAPNGAKYSHYLLD
ncbi:unnamed protein product, partial [Ectocarpus sp. 13 AM-2016]